MERLEAAVWSEASVIPLHMTLTLAKFGGLFLGAYDDDKLIGFLYSFPGYTDGESHLCSHMLGFLPEYRKQGLGVKMKWLQRDESLQLGHRKITWTYDPLETVNATLNIAKLGGIVRRYLPNCYGELNDAMNRGLPTDRFLVEWFIGSERVARYRNNKTAPLQIEGLPSALHYKIAADGLPVPLARDLELTEQTILVPVPAVFQQVKQADMKVAADWRSVTGDIFMHYFAKGYHVTNLHRDETTPMVWYILQKQPLEQLLA